MQNTPESESLLVDVSSEPGKASGIRLGHPREELVEGPFPLCFKLPDITGHHRSHRYPFNILSYAFKPESKGNVKNRNTLAH